MLHGRRGNKDMVDPIFWKGKRVFLTGHTGFKGSWLCMWLTSLGAEVRGYSLLPPTKPSLFVEARVEELVYSTIGDIRDQEVLLEAMVSFDPEVLIHMAAQPLVRYSYDNPIETYDVNVIGTAKVLEAARSCNNLKVIINVTTDKCYENDGLDKSYKETDPMGGYDPYSSSKGCAELVAGSYRRSYLVDLGIGLATVRAGNVIGGGDWASDRLIPDILRSFEENIAVKVRNPNAIRPWQHVLEPLSGYLLLAQKIYTDPKKYSEGWNFGSNEKDAKPVHWILDKMISSWPNASWVLDNKANLHEAGFLKLDISKSRERLNWHPIWELDKVLEKIVYWHKAWTNKNDMQYLCLSEINEYMRDMRSEN